ncbi:hypothetical protein L1887_60005 [Cichorium endivia]|nr:hypothetical protein L1887_60005 [Cichorium endivia]
MRTRSSNALCEQAELSRRAVRADKLCKRTSCASGQAVQADKLCKRTERTSKQTLRMKPCADGRCKSVELCALPASGSARPLTVSAQRSSSRFAAIRSALVRHGTEYRSLAHSSQLGTRKRKQSYPHHIPHSLARTQLWRVKPELREMHFDTTGSGGDLCLCLVGDGEELALLDGAGPRETGVAHEVAVDLSRTSTTLLDTPHNQRLTTSAVTGGVDTLDVGLVGRLALLVVGLDVRSAVLLETERRDGVVLGTQESEREQAEIAWPALLGARDLVHLPLARRVKLPVDLDRVERHELALSVLLERGGRDAVLARVAAPLGGHLGVTVVHLEYTRELRPGVALGTLVGRLRQQLKVDDALSAVTKRGSLSVATSVTTTNDDDVLALGAEVVAVLQTRVEERLGVGGEEVHGEVNAVGLAARHLEVTRPGGADSVDDGVVLRVHLLGVNVATNVGAGDEVDALCGHEVDTTLHDALVELHVRDTVHEQTTDAVGTLVHGDRVASLVELVRTGHTSGTGADDSDGLAGADLGRARHHPALLEALVDDGALDRLDADGLLGDAEHTSTLARSRADTTSEFGEVVGHEETVERILPLALEDEVVPLGNDVGDRATSVTLAEGHTAVHASRRLVLELGLAETSRELLVVLDTLGRRAVVLAQTLVLHEAARLVELVEPSLGSLVVDHGVLDIDNGRLSRLGSGHLADVVGGVVLGLVLGHRDIDLAAVAREGAEQVNVARTLLLDSGLGSLLLENALVVVGHNAHEARKEVVEVVQHVVGNRRAGVVAVVLDEVAQLRNLLRVLDRAQLDHLGVALAREIAVHVENVRNSARHTGGEVATSRSEDNNSAASHVLGTVVADTLDDGVRSRVTHGEALRGNSAEISVAGGNGDVATGADLAVGLDGDAATEVVEDERLMGLCETELPRQTGVLDAGPSRGTGTTVVTGDEDVVGLSLGDTGGDDADADLGDELDADAGARVGALEIVDELLEVLDRVNVVVGRGRNETDTGSRVTGAGDRGRDLVAGQLTTLTGLGTLSHLDLQLVRVGEVVARDTETARGDLLDLGAERVAVGERDGTLGVLTTLTGVRLAAETVHGDGKSRVSLHGDGAVRHGTGAEALDDLGPGLDLVDGDGARLGVVELEHTAERGGLDGVVRGLGVGVVGRLVSLARGILEVGDGHGVVDVGLTTVTVVVLTRLRQTRDGDGVTRRVAAVVELERIHGEQGEVGTRDTRGGTGEAAVDDAVGETESLEDLGALVRGEGGDTHLGHDLEDTVVDGVLPVVDELRGREVGLDETLAGDLEDGLHGEPGADGVSTVAEQHAHVVHLASLGGLDHEGDAATLLVADEVVVNTTAGDERGDGDAVGADGAVGEDDDAVAVADGLRGLGADAVEGGLVPDDALTLVVGDVDGLGSPVGVDRVDLLDGVELVDAEDGRREEQTVALLGLHLEQVALGTDVLLERHDDRLANGVDGRVGDLGEELTEVVVNDTGSGGDAGERSIVTHRTERLLTVGNHGKHEQVDLLGGVTEGEELGVGAETLLVENGSDGVAGVATNGVDDLGQAEHLVLEPGGEVGTLGSAHLELAVLDYATLDSVDKEHLTGLETALGDDGLGVDGDGADLGGADHDVVVGDVVTARTETVAVEVGTAVATVGEGEERGTVPGLHETGGPSVEGDLLGLHVAAGALPSLGDHHHDGLGQGEDLVDDEELEHVVEGSRVGSAALDDGVEEVELVAKGLGLEEALASTHPVLVAADGVDLTVVGGPSHGLSTVPGGEGVGGESRVDEGKVGGVVDVVEVVVVVVHLDGAELTLVDDVGRAERADVEPVLETDGVGGVLAEDVELTAKVLLVEGLGGVGGGGAGAVVVLEDDEGLHDLGLLGLGGRAEDGVVDGDVTPAEDAQAELVGDVGEGLDVLCARLVVLGVEEEVADGILSLRGELDAEVALGLAAEEGVGDAGHDTGAVTVASVGTDGTTVGHVAEEEACVGDDLVGGLSLDLAHEADTAGVLLVVRVVKALGSGHGAGPERGGALYLIVAAGLEVVGGDGLLVDGSELGVELINEASLFGVGLDVGDRSHNRHSSFWWWLKRLDGNGLASFDGDEAFYEYEIPLLMLCWQRQKR